MRIISAASLDKLAQLTGVEPVIIVKIFWGGSTSTDYCDRKFEQEGLVGKLVQISSIEDIINIDAASSSTSLTVTLDDTDGSIKNIYNYNDIHKTFVQILQWFSDLPKNDAFVIYEGEISSPIVWSEGARTLKFDVVTKLEDREVGFSVEEGNFDFFPANLVGQPWPIVFGKVAGVKPLSLNESPTAVLASGFGVVDEEVWEAELNGLRDAIFKADLNMRNAFTLGLQNAYKAIEFKGGIFFPDDPQQADQYDTAASSYYNQSAEYAEEKIRLMVELSVKLEERDFQRSLEFRVLPITQTNFSSGTYTVEVGNYTATGVVVGNAIILSNLQEKIDPNQRIGTNKYAFGVNNKTDEYRRQSTGQKFTWVDGGTQIKIFNYPRYYILSIGNASVINVWAKNKYGRAVVPRTWYSVSVEQFGSLTITKLIFPTPLESYPGEWQDGDLEVDCQSLSVGTNIVDIMIWVINNFSGLTYDVASFNTVRNQVANYPANFVLDRRMNVVNFLKEVAFQSRCSIWINDRKFFLRFLATELASVDTITDSDIELDSLTITSTDTERVITKFIATWKERANQREPNKIIYRNNIKKYGTIEETYNFFIFNQQELVQKAAEFWIIRRSNTFKIINCRVMLHKLAIEAFDPIEFNLDEPLIANTAITGIIQKATFDPDTDSINLEAWLPVRLGEMTKFVFAYTEDTSNIYPALDDANVLTGNPWADATGFIVPQIAFPPHWPITYSHGKPWTHGTHEPANEPPNPIDFIVALDPSEISEARPDDIENYNNQNEYRVNDLDDFKFVTTTPNSFYGEVVERINNFRYKCNVWTKDWADDPIELEVLIGKARSNSILPVGYALAVHRTIYIGKDNNNQDVTKFYYWAQPPIWEPPIEDADV